MDGKRFTLEDVFGLNQDSHANHDEAIIRIVDFCNEVQHIPPAAFSMFVEDFTNGGGKNLYSNLSPSAVLERKSMRQMLLGLLIGLLHPDSMLKQAADECAGIPDVVVPEYALNPPAPSLQSLTDEMTKMFQESEIGRRDVAALVLGSMMKSGGEDE